MHVPTLFFTMLRKKNRVFGMQGTWSISKRREQMVLELRDFACEPGCRLWDLDFVHEGAESWLHMTACRPCRYSERFMSLLDMISLCLIMMMRKMMIAMTMMMMMTTILMNGDGGHDDEEDVYADDDDDDDVC